MNTNLVVELDVGLREVIHRFRAERGFPGIPQRRGKRFARVANISETGFGIECDSHDGAQIAPGDIVALRLAPGLALELCAVVRMVPEAASGTTWIGLKRISRHARALESSVPLPGQQPIPPLLFVPAEDHDGCHDTCLVDMETFARGAAVEAHVGGCPYDFHFTRARETGRGWVLARFEIEAALYA